MRQTARPTDTTPVLLRCKTSIVLTATTSTLFINATKGVALGRHHERGTAKLERPDLLSIIILTSLRAAAAFLFHNRHVKFIIYRPGCIPGWFTPRREIEVEMYIEILELFIFKANHFLGTHGTT